jgi:hypothetical protein
LVYPYSWDYSWLALRGAKLHPRGGPFCGGPMPAVDLDQFKEAVGENTEYSPRGARVRRAGLERNSRGQHRRFTVERQRPGGARIQIHLDQERNPLVDPHDPEPERSSTLKIAVALTAPQKRVREVHRVWGFGGGIRPGSLFVLWVRSTGWIQLQAPWLVPFLYWTTSLSSAPGGMERPVCCSAHWSSSRAWRLSFHRAALNNQVLPDRGIPAAITIRERQAVVRKLARKRNLAS